MTKITPNLWFDSEAEEAANFYCTVFKNSRIVSVTRYDEATAEAANRPAGSVLTVTFELDANKFVALNGGPVFKFNEAVSLMVECHSQEEIDHYWDKLGEGGQEQACGWLKDRYGLSWQVVPAGWDRMIDDSEGGARYMKAMMQMVKLDMNKLKAAYEGAETPA